MITYIPNYSLSVSFFPDYNNKLDMRRTEGKAQIFMFHIFVLG